MNERGGPVEGVERWRDRTEGIGGESVWLCGSVCVRWLFLCKAWLTHMRAMTHPLSYACHDSIWKMTHPYPFIDEQGSGGWNGCAWFIPNGHDSFTYASWLIYTWHDSSILIHRWARQQRMTWLCMIYSKWTWLIQMRAMTHLHVTRLVYTHIHMSQAAADDMAAHDLFFKWTWLTHMRAMTHPYVTRLAHAQTHMCKAAADERAAHTHFKWTWLSQMPWLINTCHDLFQMDTTHWHACHDSFIHDMTRSYPCTDVRGSGGWRGCAQLISNGYDSLICEPWLIQTWHDSFIPIYRCARKRRMTRLRMTYSKWTWLIQNSFISLYIHMWHYSSIPIYRCARQRRMI